MLASTILGAGDGWEIHLSPFWLKGLVHLLKPSRPHLGSPPRTGLAGAGGWFDLGRWFSSTRTRGELRPALPVLIPPGHAPLGVVRFPPPGWAASLVRFPSDAVLWWLRPWADPTGSSRHFNQQPFGRVRVK